MHNCLWRALTFFSHIRTHTHSRDERYLRTCYSSQASHSRKSLAFVLSDWKKKRAFNKILSLKYINIYIRCDMCKRLALFQMCVFEGRSRHLLSCCSSPSIRHRSSLAHTNTHAHTCRLHMQNTIKAAQRISRLRRHFTNLNCTHGFGLLYNTFVVKLNRLLCTFT